jgi:toxin YoeB
LARARLTPYTCWRIDDANRLVYEATDEQVNVIACRYHY